MSSTEHRHAESGKPHSTPNQEHELSDFNWSRVIWSLPVFSAILIGFTLLCVYSYQGYLNDERLKQEAKFQTTELNILRASENEILSQSKAIDKALDRYQIPIAKAMELVVAEHQNVSGRDWKPIADVYLEGAAFEVPPEAVSVPESNGISIEEAPRSGSASAPAAHAAPVPGSHEKKSH